MKKYRISFYNTCAIINETQKIKYHIFGTTFSKESVLWAVVYKEGSFPLPLGTSGGGNLGGGDSQLY